MLVVIPDRHKKNLKLLVAIADIHRYLFRSDEEGKFIGQFMHFDRSFRRAVNHRNAGIGVWRNRGGGEGANQGDFFHGVSLTSGKSGKL